MAKARARRLTLGELQHLDAQISLAQERGLGLNDKVKAINDISCCGAVTATAKGNLVFSDRDKQILSKIAELESQIESLPTLRQLIEVRGELLRGKAAE